MLRVALTGGAASGKSVVAAVLRECGAFVSESDEVARAMMQPGEPVLRAIVERFGGAVVREDGTLNRPALARMAFGEGRLEELNAIVHPPVIRAQTEWMRQVGLDHPVAIAVVESALVLETVHGGAGGLPWRSRFDCLVLVAAPEEDRLERYVERQLAGRAVSAEARVAAVADARARFAAQMPEAEKRRFADMVVENEGTLLELRERAGGLYRSLLQREREARSAAM